jgi:hypothetical protein
MKIENILNASDREIDVNQNIRIYERVISE